MSARRAWTAAEDRVLRDRYSNSRTSDLARLLGRSERCIYDHAYTLGLRKSAEYLASPAAGRLDGIRGSSTRFKAGAPAWNKGQSYRAGGRSAETQFKPGQRPHTWLPVGAYRVNANGYLDRKITDTGYTPRDWVGVHRLVWSEAHGPIPAGHVVVFQPGRRTTQLGLITLDAVECISRAELAARNTIHRYPREVRGAIKLAAKLRRRIDEQEHR